MKLNKKIILSFILVLVILCGNLYVNAAETLVFSTDKDSTGGYIYLDSEDNNFTFDIIVDDPDFLAQGFSGVLEWDSSAIVIDDVYASGRRWTVLFNETEGDFNVAKQKDGYVANEAVVTVEGHAIADGDLTSVIKVNNLKFADRRLNPVDATDYTDKEIKVTVRRIVLTPTNPDYHDQPTPDVSITPVVSPTEEPIDEPSDTPSDIPSDTPSGSVDDNKDGKEDDKDGGKNNGATPTVTPTDKTQIPADKISQTGTGKAVAIVMGAGILASAVFYIKFSKNNY